MRAIASDRTTEIEADANQAAEIVERLGGSTSPGLDALLKGSRYEAYSPDERDIYDRVVRTRAQAFAAARRAAGGPFQTPEAAFDGFFKELVLQFGRNRSDWSVMNRIVSAGSPRANNGTPAIPTIHMGTAANMTGGYPVALGPMVFDDGSMRGYKVTGQAWVGGDESVMLFQRHGDGWQVKFRPSDFA